MNLKLFGKNTAIYAIGNVGLRAASFILIPLYTYTLSVKEYGLLATLLITIQIMLIFMGLGMRMSLVRFAKEYEDKDQIKYLLGTSTFINVAGGLGVAVLTLHYLTPFFQKVLHTEDVHTYLLLTCLGAFMQSLNTHIMSYYRARNEAIKFMSVGIFSALLLFVINIILLRIFYWGIKGALYSYILTYSFITLYVLIDVVSRTGIGFSFMLIPRLIRFGFPLVISMAGSSIIAQASVYFLSYFTDLEVVAVYSLGFKLSQLLLITIVLPFQLSFQPFVFSNLNSPDMKDSLSRMLLYFIVSISFMSLFILIGSHIILPLIAPPEYSSAYNVILLLLPLMAFIGIYYFSETLLSILEKTHFIGLAMTVCVIICIFLNYKLIPIISWYGAIIASNVSFSLVGFILLFVGIRELSLRIQWNKFFIMAGMFVSFLFLMFLLHRLNQIAFFIGSIVLLLFSMLFLYYGALFNDEEKLVLKDWVAKLTPTFPGRD
jgi:O-antigen/teichoic acid export membrane protein